MKIRIVLLVILVAGLAWLQLPIRICAAADTGVLHEGFESGSFLLSPLSWITGYGGEGLWWEEGFWSVGSPHGTCTEGRWAAVVEFTAEDNQHSWLEVGIDVKEPGAISFSYQVETSDPKDFLRFLVDYEELGRWSGKTSPGWEKASFHIDRGKHIFRWELVTGELRKSRRVYASIDDISFPAGSVGVSLLGQTPATVKEINGDVEVKGPNDKDWKKAEVGAELSPGTEVLTGIEAYVVLEWQVPIYDWISSDGEKIGKTDYQSIKVKVGELTIMKVREIYEKRDKLNGDINIKIGSVDFDIGGKEKYRSNLRVSTHSSTAGVTGSLFSISNSEDNVATITAVEGSVLVQSNFLDQKTELYGAIRFREQMGCGDIKIPGRRVTVDAEGHIISEPGFVALEAEEWRFAMPEKCFTVLAAWTNITDNLFDKLVDWWDDRIEPELAEWWDVSPDGEVVTFGLREGVKFHDGTEFNAEAVDFNFRNEIQLLPWLRWRPSPIALGLIRKIEVLDEYTVRFHLDPDEITSDELLQFLASSWWGAIVSPTAVEEFGHDFGYQPVGSGPFRVTDIYPDRVVLEAFEDYWRGPPQLKRLTFVLVPEESTRYLLLQNGEIQAMVGRDPEFYEQVQLSGFRVCGIPTDFKAVSRDVKDLVLPYFGPLSFETVSGVEELIMALPSLDSPMQGG